MSENKTIEELKDALAYDQGEPLPAPATTVVRGYRVVLEPDGDAILVECPALPEVITFGETIGEALHCAADAIEEALAGRRKRGEKIPATVDEVANLSSDLAKR